MKERDDILPTSLEETFDDLKYEEFGGLTITSVSQLDNTRLCVSFVLNTGNEADATRQHWNIIISGFCDGLHKPGTNAQWPQFYSDHPLLWPMVDDHVSLYFNHAVRSPELFLKDLWDTHVRELEGYHDFKFFTSFARFLPPVDTDMGLYASGPERLLKLYEACLDRAGAQPTIVGRWRPRRTTGTNDSSIPELILLVIGDSYFIGESIEFVQLDGDTATLSTSAGS